MSNFAWERRRRWSRLEPWLWAVVAPGPALLSAVVAGGLVGRLVHAGPVSVAVGAAVLAAVGRAARRRDAACLAGYLGGLVVLLVGLAGLVCYAVSQIELG